MIDETGATVFEHAAGQATVNFGRMRTGNLVAWWTASVVGLRRAGNLTQHHCRWRTIAPVGPGVMMAGHFLVPVTGGIGVYDPVSG